MKMDMDLSRCGVCGLLKGIICLSLVQGSVSESDTSVTIEPRNVAVLRGHNVTFSCHVIQPAYLDQYGILSFDQRITSPSGNILSVDEKIVYLGGNDTRSRRYTISRLQSHGFQLHISDTRLSDGGQYGCVPRNAHDQFRTAELIVIDRPPSCSSNAPEELMEGDVVTMTCVVTSQGRWRPVTEFASNRRSLSDQNGTVLDANTISYSTSVMVDAEDDGAVFVARTAFGELSVRTEHEATNRPIWQNIAQFKPLVVRTNHSSTSKIYTHVPTATVTTSGVASVVDLKPSLVTKILLVFLTKYFQVGLTSDV